MGRHTWTLYGRDAGYHLTGGMRLSTLKAVVRHLDVDTAVIETPYSPDAFVRTQPGLGMVAFRDGRREFSGLIASERTLGWDAKEGKPTIKVSLLGDNVHLGDRLSFPDPSRAGDNQTTYDYWMPRDGAGAPVNVAGTTAMWRLINEQLGPGARTERKVPTLTMGADPGVGTTRAYQLLFDPVLTGLQQFSVVSGSNAGVRITGQDGAIAATIYVPRDLSAGIRFSADLRNLVGFEYAEKAPTVTYALVAGQGDLHARTRKAATATEPLDLRWGRRIETYIDRRDEADTTVLQQAADDEITQGGGQVSLACTLTDSQAALYGRDWGLGDKVTVYVGLPRQAKPATVQDLVREIAFDVDNTGAEHITPAIGGPDAKAIPPSPTQRAIARLQQNLAGLIARNP